jgi:hypothetical protein
MSKVKFTGLLEIILLICTIYAKLLLPWTCTQLVTTWRIRFKVTPLRGSNRFYLNPIFTLSTEELDKRQEVACWRVFTKTRNRLLL